MKLIVTFTNTQIVRNYLYDLECNFLNELKYEELLIICNDQTHNSINRAIDSFPAEIKAKIRLDNNEYLRGRNAADSGNKDIIKVNASDELQFGTTIGSINIQDDGFTLLDNADNTKIIAFNAGNITTGTTRTLSAPDATGTLVLNDNTAAL
jgi:hypothetical protein